MFRHTSREDRVAVGRLGSDIPEEEYRWLDPGRISLGGLAIMDGDPGLGKTSVALDYAARITSGAKMPGGAKGALYGQPSGAIVISCEDNPATTLVPKLRLMGADLSRVFFIDNTRDEDDEDHSIDFLDVPALEGAIAQVKAKLVIWDPFMAYMPEGKNAYKDQDVRKSLMPLVKWAQERDIAVLCIRHVTKPIADARVAVPAFYRGAGSAGIGAAARTVLAVVRDPDDDSGELRALLSTKTNNTKECAVPGLLFRLKGKDDFSPAIIVWEGETTIKANEAMQPPNLEDEPGRIREAGEWLLAQLQDGPRSVQELYTEAKKTQIAGRTLRRAKDKLKIEARKEMGTLHGAWMWQMPTHNIRQPANGLIQDGQVDGHVEGQTSHSLRHLRGMISYW